jgi:AcrR family transcriptional regulator
LLHHFPTKESLLLAALAHRGEVDRQRASAVHLVGVDSLRRMVQLVQRQLAIPL